MEQESGLYVCMYVCMYTNERTSVFKVCGIIERQNQPTKRKKKKKVTKKK